LIFDISITEHMNIDITELHFHRYRRMKLSTDFARISAA
jgi:hypothetical protein